MRRSTPIPLAFILAAALSAVGGTATLAAAPANDDRSNAITLGPGVPDSAGPIDTRDATTDANDPTCFGEPDRATVWFSFTPGSDGHYLVDTAGSSYDTTLAVGTADGPGLDVIDCNDDARGLGVQSRVVWEAEAGTRYLIVAGSCCGGGDPSEPGGGGSELRVHLDEAPPSPSARITIDAAGSVARGGEVTVRGTIVCSHAGQGAFLGADLRQRVGRISVRAFGETFVDPCSGDGERWTITTQGENGRFAGGKLEVAVFVEACNAVECAFDSAERTIQLRR